MELYRVQLREKRQKATESLPELGQAIRRLTNLAYPSAGNDLQETLAKEQFIDALVDSDMRIRIKQSRPKTLNEAISLAVELEAYIKSDRRNQEIKNFARPLSGNEFKGSDFESRMASIEKTLDTMLRELSQLKKCRDVTHEQRKDYEKSSTIQKPKSPMSQWTCYTCGKRGHISLYCKKPKPSQDKGRSRGTDHYSGDRRPKDAEKGNSNFSSLSTEEEK